MSLGNTTHSRDYIKLVYDPYGIYFSRSFLGSRPQINIESGCPTRWLNPPPPSHVVIYGASAGL